MQVFFSVLLLMSAGLFVRTLGKLRSLDLGFQTASVISFLRRSEHQRVPARACRRLLPVANRGSPFGSGVESAALGTIRLLDDESWAQGIFLDGYTPAPDESNTQSFNMVSTGYFATMGIPVVEGREFTASDAGGGHLVAVVNQEIARKYFGRESAVGRHFRLGGPEGTQVEIVGVIGATKYDRVRDSTRRRRHS
jgi:hypothetical protein